ncbi:MAG: LysM peptidoglycan-binding domain-containing protein [Anaerolineales bacterium]|nr:LysM peptidoglycan-binding domain-containing protein [Anaerolineales bacterium]
MPNCVKLPSMGSVRRSNSNWKQYLPYLGLNIAISVGAMLLVLFFWTRRPSPPELSPTPTGNIADAIATLMPTVTPTLPPSPTPHVYEVKPGDTLYDISLELDISMDALMAANGISNADALSVGQIIIIPPPEWVDRFEETQEDLAAGVEVTPSPEVELPRVEINSVNGVGDVDVERITLLNNGGPAYMRGWRLEDDKGNVYIFPTFTLYSGAVNLNIRSGVDTSIDLFWGLDESILEPGNVLTLYDASRMVVATFRIPSQ